MKNVDKGVAIPYIIALVMGLIVLVIVTYLMYRTSSSSTLSLQECKSRYMAWCTNCAQMNWPQWHCIPKAVWDCREILQKAGFNVPSGGCVHFDNVGVSVCNSTEVRKDCAVLGVCLNNDEYC